MSLRCRRLGRSGRGRGAACGSVDVHRSSGGKWTSTSALRWTTFHDARVMRPANRSRERSERLAKGVGLPPEARTERTNRPPSPRLRWAPSRELRAKCGGESGFEHHGRVSPTHAFQACSIDQPKPPSRMFDSTCPVQPFAETRLATIKGIVPDLLSVKRSLTTICSRLIVHSRGESGIRAHESSMS